MSIDIEKTIVAFHVGRGGRFYNPRHLTYLDDKPISAYTDGLFIDYENLKEVMDRLKDHPNLLAKLEQCIDKGDVSFFGKLGLDLGEEVYIDECGNPVELTVKEAETGIGCINIDNEYNTTYTCYLEDCSEYELEAILRSDRFVPDGVLEYAKRAKEC